MIVWMKIIKPLTWMSKLQPPWSNNPVKLCLFTCAVRSRPSVRPGRSSSVGVCPHHGRTDHQEHTEIDKKSSVTTGRVKQITPPDHSPPPAGTRPRLRFRYIRHIRLSFINVNITCTNAVGISYKPIIRTEFGLPGCGQSSSSRSFKRPLQWSVWSLFFWKTAAGRLDQNPIRFLDV